MSAGPALAPFPAAGVLAGHAVVVGAAHLLLLTLFASLPVVAVCTSIALLHGLGDGARRAWGHRVAGSLALFVMTRGSPWPSSPSPASRS